MNIKEHRLISKVEHTNFKIEERLQELRNYIYDKTDDNETREKFDSLRLEVENLLKILHKDYRNSYYTHKRLLKCTATFLETAANMNFDIVSGHIWSHLEDDYE